MSKRTKIKEAEHFLSQMKTEQHNRENFEFSLSAFLSAARSVLQYAYEEVKKARTREMKWYENSVSGSQIIGFLKDKRDNNIHIEPVKPRADFLIKVTEPISVSISGSDVSLEHRDKNGKLILQSSSKEPKPKPKPKKPTGSAESKSTFRFNDWMKYCQSNNLKDFTENEDVLTLCERYIQELEKVVKDGVSKGYITG